jgi:hypothetical protein
MQMCENVEAHHTYLTSTQDWDEWLASHTDRLTFEE